MCQIWFLRVVGIGAAVSLLVSITEWVRASARAVCAKDSSSISAAFGCTSGEPECSQPEVASSTVGGW